MANNNFLDLRVQDLTTNPTPRIAICLCLDGSFSMGATEGGVPTGETYYKDGKEWIIVDGGTSRIKEMEEGVRKFLQALREDLLAFYSAEISVVIFDDKAECVLDFANLEHQKELPKFIHKGETAMGEGVNLALDLLEKRKAEYQEAGVDYFQPWLVLMTDGACTGSRIELEKAVKRVDELTNDKKLTVFAIGVGEDADMNVLNRLSPKRSALHLKDLKFQQFFEWLSKSVAQVSHSVPGTKVDVCDGIQGWGEL